MGMLRKLPQRIPNRLLPLDPGEIGPKRHSPRPPGTAVESADFDNEITLLLTEGSQFLPILNIKTGVDSIRRERCRVQNPGIGNPSLQGLHASLSKLTHPELPQGSHPEEPHPEFLLQLGLRRRCDGHFPGQGVTKEPLRAGDLWKVEHLEEAVDIPVPGVPIGLVANLP